MASTPWFRLPATFWILSAFPSAAMTVNTEQDHPRTTGTCTTMTRVLRKRAETLSAETAVTNSCVYAKENFALEEVTNVAFVSLSRSNTNDQKINENAFNV
ncbi:unnamed protein product [Macrosiphum euphorbiae]|uniref:Secreted protein n=1 Tax=Macrosiphum euphorbiae TaxID=13131 RepID=A0AAV0WM15_9HEMI|nr:unnamed protein product [Macrosiphum euphorbiae]